MAAIADLDTILEQLTPTAVDDELHKAERRVRILRAMQAEFAGNGNGKDDPAKDDPDKVKGNRKGKGTRGPYKTKKSRQPRQPRAAKVAKAAEAEEPAKAAAPPASSRGSSRPLSKVKLDALASQLGVFLLRNGPARSDKIKRELNCGWDELEQVVEAVSWFEKNGAMYELTGDGNAHFNLDKVNAER